MGLAQEAIIAIIYDAEAAFKRIEDERDAYKAALNKLVQLKIGPKDSVYHREKPKAWQEAADLLGIDTVIFP